jgi:hypothetical protein
MWQFVTVDAAANGAALESLQRGLSTPRSIGEVTHGLTHRRYRFQVFACNASAKRPADVDGPRKWVTLAELEAYPLPRPHLKIDELLRTDTGRTLTSAPRPLALPATSSVSAPCWDRTSRLPVWSRAVLHC